VLAFQRRELIIQALEQRRSVRVTELAVAMGVSDMTVRRDLDELARVGLLEKVHGGATAMVSPRSLEPAYATKALMEREAKEAIGAVAAKLVTPGSSIALSAGSTTALIAQHLLEIDDLTVVTNSVPVAEIFHQRSNPRQTILLTGGIRTPSDALVGPVAVAALERLHVDMAFMGAHGMDLDAGFTTPNLMESEINRAMAGACRELIVVADHTKWGVIGFSAFATFSEVSRLMTDDGIAREAREELEGQIARLDVVKVN
jgi:DeoR/GlpR family transcriptional regulator of sugar metabolism